MSRESRFRLPAIPPAQGGQHVEISDETFVAWDVMDPWGLPGVAFVKSEDGAVTVWTPGHLNEWTWRGPRHITPENANALPRWLAQQHFEDVPVDLTSSGLVELDDNSIMIWDPDHELEGGVGFLRLDDGGYELALVMAGLTRGKARIRKEEGRRLIAWLDPKGNT